MVDEEEDNGFTIRDDVTGRKKIRPLNRTKLSEEELENILIDTEDEL